MATNEEILRAFQKNASAIHQLERLTETIQEKLDTVEAENAKLKDLPITEHPDVQRLIAETVKLQAENAKLKEELALHRWIPVGERLPTGHGIYQVAGDGKVLILSGYFTKERVWVTGLEEVTHWKPIILPE